MRRVLCFVVAVAAMSTAMRPSNAHGQYGQEATVQASITVLNSTMSSSLRRIPEAMLSDAHAVAIIPNVIKGGFVVGARRGRGLMCVREADGVWHAPVFVTLTGGNIGWQVGVQSSDIVLVFKTRRSVEGVLAGKLTVGADAAAAAGPLGRQGGIATDATLEAEIYSYSRSRGLFAGVSIDGSVLRMDRVATDTYYRSGIAGQVVPDSARALTETIAAYAGAGAVERMPPVTISSQPVLSSPMASGELPSQYGTTQSDLLRGQLSQLAPQLYDLLDDQWASYLALPSALFLEGEHPRPQELDQTLSRFRNVAADPKFQQLAARPEFQSLHAVLKHYQQSLVAAPSTMQLPPPPNR